MIQYIICSKILQTTRISINRILNIRFVNNIIMERMKLSLGGIEDVI